MKSKCLLALLLLCTSMPAPGSATTLLLPKDKVWSPAAEVLVLGAARPGANVSVRLEAGGEIREGAADAGPGGRFQFVLPLRPGLNRLAVAGEPRELFVTGGGERAPAGFREQRLHAGTIASCQDCHFPDLSVRGDYPEVCTACHEVEAQNPASLSRASDDRHFLASGGKCGKCHDPHGATDQDLLLASPTELCGTCHGSREEAADLHPAFDDGGCVACHDPHFSGYPAQLAGTLGEVCGNCHDEVLTAGHGEDLEDCSGCHDPHATVGRALARGDFAERCAECHDDVAGYAREHPALEEGCETCHDPHAEGRDGMLQARQAELCGECHEIAVAGAGRVRHEPAEDCTDCHGPHGGDRPAFLASAVPDLCLGCHEDPRRAGATVHGALDEAGCLFCHDPHAGYALGMLRGRETELCSECHDLAPQGPHAEEITAEGCSCCHEPHASDAPQFLRDAASSHLQNRKPCVPSVQ